MVELFTQTAYFAFQVVQVFLITTLSSAASSAFFRILLNPLYAKDLLAMNLPRASNFYISYILVQCLASAGTNLVHPLDLIRHTLVRRVTQFPRFQYKLWRTMRPARWGRDFPVFANLGVIGMSLVVFYLSRARINICHSPLLCLYCATNPHLCCRRHGHHPRRLAVQPHLCRRLHL
jgi:calcium permeable stress-gated cation channel